MFSRRDASQPAQHSHFGVTDELWKLADSAWEKQVFRQLFTSSCWVGQRQKHQNKTGRSTVSHTVTSGNRNRPNCRVDNLYPLRMNPSQTTTSASEPPSKRFCTSVNQTVFVRIATWHSTKKQKSLIDSQGPMTSCLRNTCENVKERGKMQC